MTKRLYWHVGTPKSGTTYVQSVLRHNAERLAASGWLVAGESHLELVRSGMAVREDPNLATLPEQARNSWTRVVQQIREWSGDCVLSYELFAGASPEQIARAMAEFEGHEIHVVVTARELGAVVPSGWQERLKFGLTTELEAWEPRPEAAGPVAQWSWRTLDAASVADRWGGALPEPARLHLVTVPPQAAPGELWRRFAEACSLDVPGLDLAVERANESLTPARAEVLRRVNEHVAATFDGPREASVWLRDMLAHRILARGGGERPGLTDEQFAALQARGEASIERLGNAGWTVHGDLADLRTRRPEGRTPGEVADGEIADVAIEAVAALLLELRTARHAAPRQEPVEDVQQGLRGRVRRLGATVVLDQLRRRIGVLEAKVQEERRLHQRVAELEDLVAELLLPAEGKGDEVVRRAIHRYRRGSL